MTTKRLQSTLIYGLCQILACQHTLKATNDHPYIVSNIFSFEPMDIYKSDAYLENDLPLLSKHFLIPSGVIITLLILPVFF